VRDTLAACQIFDATNYIDVIPQMREPVHAVQIWGPWAITFRFRCVIMEMLTGTAFGRRVEVD
jgi:hypothetical protein